MLQGKKYVSVITKGKVFRKFIDISICFREIVEKCLKYFRIDYRRSSKLGHDSKKSAKLSELSGH